jgi:Flp pilus assembly protein TadG
MSGFLKKRILKWSVISVLGLGAYFLGFSQGLHSSADLQAAAQAEADAKAKSQALVQAKDAAKDSSQDLTQNSSGEDGALIVLPNSLSTAAIASSAKASL